MERRRDDHQNGNLNCSFCGKSQKEVKKLIAGPTVYICDECIGLCNDIIAEEVEKDEPYAGSAPVPKPSEIKANGGGITLNAPTVDLAGILQADSVSPATGFIDIDASQNVILEVSSSIIAAGY